MTTETPEYLYHYTNVETLALILKNRTIRFNSLDKLDDLEEQKTADVKNLGQFYYVSCWTDDAKESIPMWNMYSGLDRGVRIGLKKTPFRRYRDTKTHDRKGNAIFVAECYLPEQLFCNYTTIPFWKSEEILFPIEYTNKRTKLYPQIVSSDQLSTAFHLLGKCKNEHWKFQNEWRYILRLFPKQANHTLEALHEDSFNVYRRVLKGIEKQPVSYIDLSIDDDAFQTMEIMLSPQISAGNKLIAELLVQSHNPNAVLRNSDLLGVIAM